jgi:hypothetical protein
VAPLLWCASGGGRGSQACRPLVLGLREQAPGGGVHGRAHQVRGPGAGTRPPVRTTHRDSHNACVQPTGLARTGAGGGGGAVFDCPARRRRYTPHTHSLGASPCLQPAGPPPPCPSPLCTDYDPESEKTGHERPASKSVDVTRACAPRYPPAAATDATPAGSAARPSPCPAVRPRPGL